MSKIQTALKEMKAATQDASRVLSAMTRSASRLSAQNTSTLYGVIGGFFGIGIAYALSLAFPVSLSVGAIILMGFGIVGGVLFYRGLPRVGLDTRLDENRFAAEEMLRRIKQLPRHVPQHVRDEMWMTYKMLNSYTQFRRTLEVFPEADVTERELELFTAASPSRTQASHTVHSYEEKP
jgi:hypothetical protein